MALTASTIQKLETIKACILAEPELYNQGEYPLSGYRNCDSPCCFEGWAMWIADPDPVRYDAELAKCGVFPTEKVAASLGITTHQYARLFSKWPDMGSPAWTKPGTKAAARDGAKRIDLFIQSGGTV